MTTVLASEGRIVLPNAVRKRLRLEPGDDFAVSVEDDETITLRRVTLPANRGLVDLLLACPAPFEVPARNPDDREPPAL